MDPASGQYILSCDWGTSSFRLRLVSLGDHEIKGEVTSGEGIADTFNRWKLQGMPDRLDFYRKELRKYIRSLRSRHSFPENTPVVISGMASSSIGMKELPYASIPFPLDGSKAIIQKLDPAGDLPHAVYLISGLRDEHDVMRGEETQLMGLTTHFREYMERAETSLFIFPGTHSKHIYLRRGQITGFQTYMTGEVFKVLCDSSILREAVEQRAMDTMRDRDRQAFREGVKQAGARGLLQALFSVRTNQLFEKLHKQQNFWYLSGLLIGAELSNLKEKKALPLVICSGSAFSDLYKLAVQESGLQNASTFVQPQLADRAAVDGHLRLYRQIG